MGSNNWRNTKRKCLVASVALTLVLVGCSRGANPNAADDADEQPAETSGEGGSPAETTVAPTTTEPPPPELSDLRTDPVFAGSNSESDINAAIDVMTENSFDYNADGLSTGIGDCSQLNGGFLSQFLGAELVVLPDGSQLTQRPYLTCKLVAADDPEKLLGQIHFSPDEDGFGPGWRSMNNNGENLTPVAGLGDSAGWSEGAENQQFFSILVVVQAGTQSAIEFRNPDGTLFAPGKIPGMIGALSQATADISAP